MTRVAKFKTFFTRRNIVICCGVVILLFLVLYRLGNLVPGLSTNELHDVNFGLGWHGLYNNPLFLPLQFLRSGFFYLLSNHAIQISRLPNALFGVWAVLSFALVIRAWHDTRTAILATALFATSAWTLHVSRIASFDVMYLWLVPTLLLTHVLLKRFSDRRYLLLALVPIWGFMLTIPGAIWLIAANMVLQRKDLLASWNSSANLWIKSIIVFLGIFWLFILGWIFTGHGGVLNFFGIPTHYIGITHIVKDFAGVPINIFVAGPHNPLLWMGRAPILDIFCLAMCLLGIYYYADHWDAPRSILLGVFLLIGFLLVGLAGLVGLSIIIPLLYVFIAMGIAFLTKQWLKVFPVNPLARSLGLAVVYLAVLLSCTYNLRSYFIAWPSNNVTKSTYHIKLQ